MGTTRTSLAFPVVPYAFEEQSPLVIQLVIPDLDVDVTWRPGEAPRVEDEDESALHAPRYGYPEELRRGVAAATRDLLAAVAARQFPFDGTAEAWWEACFGGAAAGQP